MVHPDKCKHPQAKEAFGGFVDLFFLPAPFSSDIGCQRDYSFPDKTQKIDNHEIFLYWTQLQFS